MRQLEIYLNQQKAGVLTEHTPGKGYAFCYDDAFLASPLPPISVTLPKQKARYESDVLFPFFTNLLPEGANRKVICQRQRIDEQDFFGLLSAMAGQDFVGAVEIKKMSRYGN